MTQRGGTGRVVFVWGLKRSGIHLIVNWLYANLGGRSKEDLDATGLHPQLFDGFCDDAAGVTFFNNCGRRNSRQLELGSLTTADFVDAARPWRATVFGIEDCALRYASETSAVVGSSNVLVLRDPLNHVASRLAAAETRPELFRVDEPYVDLLDAYCAEYLGRSSRLAPLVTVSFNRFVVDRGYRDGLAASMGLENVDFVSEVSSYGGGSSFSGTGEPVSPDALMTRFRERPLPPSLLDQLLSRPAIREVCAAVFGYDLEAAAGAE